MVTKFAAILNHGQMHLPVLKSKCAQWCSLSLRTLWQDTEKVSLSHFSCPGGMGCSICRTIRNGIALVTAPCLLLHPFCHTTPNNICESAPCNPDSDSDFRYSTPAGGRLSRICTGGCPAIIASSTMPYHQHVHTC
eukprot:363186-Chlamydomonas_euryale.AAC.6